MKIATGGWADIARDHGRTVFLAARELAGDDDSAWDCVQEAFVTALSRGAAEVTKPVSWLCGVAKNHARNLRRSRRRWWSFFARLTERRVEVAATPAAAEDEGLSRALSRLPAAEREAVVLRYLGEMSMAEVAAAQRISEDAAKARVHRGLRRLRRALGTTASLALLVRTAAASADRRGALLAAAQAGAAAALTFATVSGFLLPFLLVGAACLTFRSSPDDRPPAPTREVALASLAPRTALPAAPVRAQNGRHRVVFRNLQDGSPLPGFDVKLGSKTWTAGPDGAIELPPMMASVAPVAPGWRHIGEPDQALREGGDLWFYREVEVRGRVTVPADPDLPLTEVEIRWRYRDGSRVFGREERVAFWDEAGPAMRQLRGCHDPIRPAPDGSFTIVAPAIQGLYVSAYVPHFMEATGDVPLAGGGPPGEVALAIRNRAIRLHGTIRGRDGAPLRHLRLSAVVTERMSGAEYARRPYPVLGHGLTSSVGAEGAVVSHHTSGATGPRGTLGPGQFEIWVGLPGEILIAAWPPGGYAPVEHRITRGVGDDGRVRIQLDWVGEDAHVILTSGGRPIAPGHAEFLDFSLGGPQLGFKVPIEPGGRLPTALLKEGHRYRVDFHASVHPIRYFEWQPADRLEIDNLPIEPTWW